MTPAETFLALSSLQHQVCFDCSGFLLLTADSLCRLSCFTSSAPALISLPSLQIPGILFVFGHWKIIVSCFENTQITITSLFSGLSKFHQQPSPQRVNVGGAARFECQIEGVPTPVITWEKDKVAVPEETR